MRDHPFETREELEAYFGEPKVQCLECGKWFRSLGTHLRRMHGMMSSDYREKWNIPKRRGLCGTATSEILSQQMTGCIEAGRVSHDHLDAAREASRLNRNRRKNAIDHERHRKRVAELRPGDHSRLPPGAKRKDGTDADRRREYQIADRARKKGDPTLMQQYRAKYHLDT